MAQYNSVNNTLQHIQTYHFLLFPHCPHECPPGPGGDSTLIRRVCATGVLNIPPCSGAKSVNHISCSGVTTPSLNQLYCIVLYCIVLYCIVLYCIVLYCIVLYCIVLYCIVLETKTIFMLYLFNQMMLPFHFSSAMFALKSFKFSVTAIS